MISDLIANADLAKQAMPGTPDGWLLFPTTGTPPGGMDLDAVLLADPAAARRGSNTTAALRVVLEDPRGTGIHLPALDSGMDARAVQPELLGQDQRRDERGYTDHGAQPSSMALRELTRHLLLLVNQYGSLSDRLGAITGRRLADVAAEFAAVRTRAGVAAVQRDSRRRQRYDQPAPEGGRCLVALGG